MNLNRLLPCSAALAVIALALLPLPVSAQQKGMTVQQVYEQAQKDLAEGRIQQAQQGFALVLEHSPNFIYARKGLADCAAALKNPAPKQDPLSQLSTLIVPSIEFDNATLGTVIEYVSQKAEELSGGKITPNFVFRGTAEEKEKLTVSMKLRNTPLSEVLRYAGQVTGARFANEQYAIVCLPPSASAGTPEPAVQQSANGTTPATNPLPPPPSTSNNPGLSFRSL